MGVYEKHDDQGNVVERTHTPEGSDYDAEMQRHADDPASPWRRAEQAVKHVVDELFDHRVLGADLAEQTGTVGGELPTPDWPPTPTPAPLAPAELAPPVEPTQEG